MSMDIEKVQPVGKVKSEYSKSAVPWLFCIRFVPISLLITVISLYLYFTYKVNQIVIIQNREQTTIDIQKNVLEDKIYSIVSDLRVLSSHYELKEFLVDKNPDTLEHLQEEFYLFSESKRVFDQVRLISREGMEEIRINMGNDDPEIISQDALQSKAFRYYFLESMKLDPGQIYVSRFDLNVENGQVEIPQKPMIRFCSPIFDLDNIRRGVIVINFLGKELFRELHIFSKDIQLLNSHGYWLLNPVAENQWGFMFPDKQENSLAFRDREKWEFISQDGDGQRIDPDGMITFRKVYPFRERSGIAPVNGTAHDPALQIIPLQDYHWYLVSFIPSDSLYTESNRFFYHMFWVSCILILLAAAVSWYWSLAIQRQQQAVVSVQESEARLRAIMDNVVDGLVTIDCQGRIESINPAVEKIFGYTSSELLGHNVKLLMPEPHHSQHDEYLQRYLQHGEARIIGIGRELFGKRKDGSLFPLELAVSEIQLEGKHFFSGILRDISERKRIEETLRESERRFRGLVTNIPGVIYRCQLDEDWTMLFMSDGVETLTGYPALEFVHNKIRTYASVIHPDDRESVDRIVNEQIAKRKPFELEYRVIRKDGVIRWVYEKGLGVKNDRGNVDYLDGAIFDINDLKETQLKLQEAQARETVQQAKLDMSGSVLHDIGNAVTNLGTTISRLLAETDWAESQELDNLRQLVEAEKDAFAKILGEGRDDALIEFLQELNGSLLKRSRNYHSDFQRSSKIIAHINEILHLQRRYAREGDIIQRGRLKLPEIINDSLVMIEGSLEKRDIQVRIDCPETLPLLSGDRTRLMQVFINLIKNASEAFDATKDKEQAEKKTLTISMSTEKNGGIIVRIEDNACGFEPEMAEQFFERGFSTKKRDSGLGLSQCRQIIQSHGGKLWLESEGIGRGSTAIILLPAASGDQT